MRFIQIINSFVEQKQNMVQQSNLYYIST